MSNELNAPEHQLHIPGLDPALRMQVHSSADVHVSASIVAEGIWEPLETRFLQDTLRPGQVFVDVGANIGYFSLVASRLVGVSGEVLAFEPETLNYELLERNCRLNACDNVRTFKAALGEENASGQIYLNELNRGDHSLYPGDEVRASQDINIVNGAKLIMASHPRVNFIKIDTQGAECDVLAGLLPLVEASFPDLTLIIEFSPMHLKNAGASGRKLLDLLAAQPWHMYLMDYDAAGVLPFTAQQVRSLNDLTEADPASEGFFNLIASGRPLEDNPGIRFVRDWGMFETALEYYLLSKRMPAWDGSGCGPGDIEHAFYLPQGWAFPEEWGRWSIGKRSVLKFKPAAGLGAMREPVLQIRGCYFGPAELTGVYLDGQCLGRFDLADAAIPLPAGVLAQDWVALEFEHEQPLRPSACSDSNDDREIKFGLEFIAIGTSTGFN
jgi:FkbM family methyltransferase